MTKQEHPSEEPQPRRHPFPRLPADFFREEAVRTYSERQSLAGDVLRIAPSWTRWFYWVLVIIFLGGITFAYFGTIDEYARGVAVIQLEGRTDPTVRVLAVLPGQYRPMIEPGMPLLLEVSGYRHSPLQMTLDSVDDRVLSPAEARREVGPEIGETLNLSGPLTLVHARLATRTFEADGRVYSLYDGMQGFALARVRRERILFLLAPKLKTLLGGERG
jgi:hypothetical protein